ncbi:hypothetical protein E8E11_008612 [Didymella keratinophila]|nr:hypothetical protein E8E11_008612 [Didymella keratinophila]
MSGFAQPGDVHAAFGIPSHENVENFLRERERKAINELIYSNVPSMAEIKEIQNARDVKNLDTLNLDERDLLAVALGAPARQVILRAEEVGPATGWRDRYLSTEYGFQPPDTNAAAGALRNSPGRIWVDLCERIPGCVARGRVRESVAALPVVEGTADVIPDKALWAALVALGMLCSIYRYEERHDGNEGINTTAKPLKLKGVSMCEDLGDEVHNIPRSIGLAYVQICIRMGIDTSPYFFDQLSYNVDYIDTQSKQPYVRQFDNTRLRWAMFGNNAENAFLKGCADTSAGFQHGADAIAACQEHVMNRNNEGLLRELIRLREILERMPTAFNTISPNDKSGENYVSPTEWFPPYLVMDAFLGRKKYDSFLGAEGVHLRAWLPSNLRASIASIEYHYRIPEYVKSCHTNDSRVWIGVHGKVYDVTDFCAMHPGGTNIIKSNGGVDCSKSFDLLAHTNNPEVSSLLTKYYVNELTPKPAHHAEELNMLYDLWNAYLRVATEQVVASHFEVGMITESSSVWFQGDLFNMGGVRRFYHSRQGITAYAQRSVQFDMDFLEAIRDEAYPNELNSASLVAHRSVGLNGQHAARAMNTSSGAPAYEQYTQSNALKAMSTFMDSNKKAIRRLSKLPASMDLQQLMQAYGSLPETLQVMPTPPSSHPSISPKRRKSCRAFQNGQNPPRKIINSAQPHVDSLLIENTGQRLL